MLGQGRGSGLRWEARGRFGYIRRACYSRRRGLWQRYGGQILGYKVRGVLEPRYLFIA